jgi:hypothetical protein
MTTGSTTSSSSPSAKATLQKAIKEAHFRSGKEFSFTIPAQGFVEGYGIPVRSGSHDTSIPFPDRTPILTRRSSVAINSTDKKERKIKEKTELITLRKSVQENKYLKKKQLKAIKNNAWEHPVLDFILSKAPEWIRKEITIKDKLHSIPGEKLEILFGTTWARNLIEINPVRFFEKLDTSWSTIRNFIQQLDDLKKIKFRDDLTDQLLSLYQRRILRMEVSIQYTLDDLIEIIKNITDIQEMNIFTADGLLIQSEIRHFSKRAIDLLFLNRYGQVFQDIAKTYPTIMNEIILLAKTDPDDRYYEHRMIDIAQLLILCSLGEYTAWILENRVLHLQDLWKYTNSGRYTVNQKRACIRIHHYYSKALKDYTIIEYRMLCRVFRRQVRNNKKLFTLLGNNKIDITDIILAPKK